MTTMYWSKKSLQFQRTADADTIAVPSGIHAQLLEDQRGGKDIARQPDGTPNDVAALLSLNGMRLAVLREVRAARAPILNALTGVGYDALRMAASSNPTIAAQGVALALDVDAARTFLKNATVDPDALAVTPGTGGWELMGAIIVNKWKAYANSSPAIIKAAFAEVA